MKTILAFLLVSVAACSSAPKTVAYTTPSWSDGDPGLLTTPGFHCWRNLTFQCRN